MTSLSLPPPIKDVKASYWLADEHKDFPAKDIDWTLFTHLFCGFADLDTETYEVKNSAQFSDFTDKAAGSGVQTLLSIGGGKTENTIAFASMVSNTDHRKVFIDSSISVARDNYFHGLDLVWKYPSNALEMTNFGTLLEKLQDAIQDDAEKRDRPPLLLTLAVYYSPFYNSLKYPVDKINAKVDFVNIMAYDFYTPSSKLTEPPAALHGYFRDERKGRNGKSGLDDWLEAGLLANKIVLGFPYVGWAWTLTDAKVHDYGAATTGPAISDDGSITYKDIREYIDRNGASTYNDPELIGDYCHFRTTWIGYDDNQSIVSKVKYAKTTGLRGYFSWHVGADHNCGLSRAASVEWGPVEKRPEPKNLTGDDK